MLENNLKIYRKFFSLMLAFVLLLSASRSGFFAGPVSAQVFGCTNDLQNVATPLIDLGTETYTRSGMSKQGGLYEGGTNVRPQAHLETVLSQVSQITPLDTAGAPDPEGKIVVVSMGMSNAAQEFGKFINLVHTNNGVAEGLNPNLQIVNGAKGGQVARNWVNPEFYDSTWGWVESQLAANDVTANQVEVLWMKHAEGGFSRNFGDRNEELKANLRTIIAMATDGRYPNLKIIYLSSRTRGYVDQFNPGNYNTLSPEPTAYEYGFAIKEIISEYMETSMNLPVPVAITWGPYLWIDGENERSDGLTWPASMLVEDCTHPSAFPGGGQDTVANMLMNFFTTDETASIWFLDNPSPTATPTATATRGPIPRATSTPSPAETATVGPRATATASPTAVPPTATNTPIPRSNIVFMEEADAVILSNRPTSNLGLSPQLSTDASPEILSLLRFNVQGFSGTITDATLRLFVQSDSSVGFDIAQVPSNSWVETAVTYDTAPAIGSIITSSGSFSAGSWVEIDVTSYITGKGQFSLAVSSNDSNQLTFSSREGNNPPELVISVSSGTVPTPSSTPITPTATNTPAPTKTPTVAPSPTPTDTPNPTDTPAPTNTPVPNTTFTYTTAADAIVLSNLADSNFGLSTQLAADASPEILSFVRFNVQGLPGDVISARLRLFVQTDSVLGFNVFEVADTSWSETNITYDNAPVVGPFVNSSGAITSGEWIVVDVTPFVVGDGLYSLAITVDDSNRLLFSSREGANPPELVVEVAAPKLD